MSNSSIPVREEDVRDTEGQIPSETESSFGDILNQFEQSHCSMICRNDRYAVSHLTIAAVVVTANAESVFFDIGQKTEGVLPLAALCDEQGPIPVKAGDVVQVSVGSRNSEGYYQLSLIKVERPKDWSSLQKAFDEKLTICGVVTQVIKGGLAVDVGVRAFMPASRSGARDVPEMQTMVGQEIACRVIKLDTEKESNT